MKGFSLTPLTTFSNDSSDKKTTPYRTRYNWKTLKTAMNMEYGRCIAKKNAVPRCKQLIVVGRPRDGGIRISSATTQ